MLDATGLWVVGKQRRTMMNTTQTTAVEPIGVDQRPRVKGPGTSLFRPEVIRRNMGVVYEVYNPITEALRKR